MGLVCDHDHGGVGLTAESLATRLDLAERLTVEAGERMTAPRRRVLELLLQAGEPVKAYDLIARYGHDGQAAKPPTVYRALDFLERRGLVHRIASISAYVACTEGEGTHAAAFLICDCCGTTREMVPQLDDTLTRVARQSGYRLDRTTIEGHGLCPACQ